MKKLAVVSITITFLVGLYFGLNLKNFRSENYYPKVLGVPVPAEEKGVDIEIKGAKFKAFYLKVPYGGDIILIPNFSEKETSANIFERSKCRALISGGFYNLDGSPTGLFISEGQEIKGYSRSSLANAIYSLNDFETPRITQPPPRDHLRIALQAGPLLIENSLRQKLRLARDEEARRIVLAITGENESVFIVFFSPESVYSGPKLADLADVLNEFQSKTGIILADAMNLDGGTASAFYTDEIRLPETKSVGSFLCIKK